MKGARYFFKRLAPLYCLCLLSSCATLRGSHQRLKVASSPPGAEIFHDGELLGVTPKFVELKRQRNDSLDLKLKGFKNYHVDFHGDYRWGDSFAANFILLNPFYVAAGLGIDLWSKSAWEYPRQGLFRFAPDKPTQPTPMKKIAIAPPQASNAVLSDELAQRLSERVKEKFYRVPVEDYKSTLVKFARFAYDNESQTPAEYRDDLYYDLDVTHIIETTTTDDGDKVTLHSSVIDVFTDQTVDRFQTQIDRRKVRSLNEGFWGAQLRSLTSFVPNNLGFNFSNPDVVMSQNVDKPLQYQAHLDREQTVLSLLSGISLRNVKPSEVSRHWKPTFRLIPALNVNYSHLVFDRDVQNELSGVSFRWYQFAAGFGPELGLEMPVGLLYLDGIPYLGGSVINWNKDGEHTDARGNLSIELEFGYLVFLSQSINLRIYYDAFSGNANQWSSVLSQASGRELKINSATTESVGFSIGYFLPEARTTARNLVQ